MNTKRLLAVFLLFVSFPLALSADKLMRDCIVNMPDGVLPLLTKVNREDCVDFMEAGMEARVTNRLDGTTQLVALTPDYALWHYTSVTEIEMKLLPVTDSTHVVCMVHRVLVPRTDSSVCFYDDDWNLLPADDFLTMPVEADTLGAVMRTRVFSLSPSDASLAVETNSESYEATDAEPSVQCGQTKVTIVWTDGKFR